MGCCFQLHSTSSISLSTCKNPLCNVWCDMLLRYSWSIYSFLWALLSFHSGISMDSVQSPMQIALHRAERIQSVSLVCQELSLSWKDKISILNSTWCMVSILVIVYCNPPIVCHTPSLLGAPSPQQPGPPAPGHRTGPAAQPNLADGETAPV